MTVTKEVFTFLGYNSFLISSYVIVGLKVDHPLNEYSGPLVCQMVQYTSAIGSIVALWSSSGIALMRFFYIKVSNETKLAFYSDAFKDIFQIPRPQESLMYWVRTLWLS